ncbi:MAG TPA: DegV family protein [Clostridiales bacterium]|nr:DegV family protein [Clostridiales bacterium]
MIAIVTDSTAYLTKQEADSLGVHMVPMTYTVSGRSYIEGYAGQNGGFVQLLESGYGVHTSQVSVASFASVFDELLRKGYDVLCLVISSRLSGTYSSALSASKEFPPDRIRIVDSLTTAGGMQILIEHISRLIPTGISLDKLVEEVERLRAKVELGFTVKNINPLRSSGRLAIVRQSVGTILNIRPVLKLSDGAIVSMGKARGNNELIRKLLDLITTDTGRIIIMHSNNYNLALTLQRFAKHRFTKARIDIKELGPVITAHVGLGVLGIAWDLNL